MVNYDLGIIRVGELEVACANFKVSAKQSSDKIDVTSSYDSVGWKHGKREYSAECSDVFPEQMPAIRQLFLSKEEFALSTYNILEDGTYQEGVVLLGAIITEFDDEMNEGESASFKVEALSLQE